MNLLNLQQSQDDEGNEIWSDGGAVAAARLSLLVRDRQNCPTGSPAEA